MKVKNLVVIIDEEGNKSGKFKLTGVSLQKDGMNRHFNISDFCFYIIFPCLSKGIRYRTADRFF